MIFIENMRIKLMAIIAFLSSCESNTKVTENNEEIVSNVYALTEKISKLIKAENIDPSFSVGGKNNLILQDFEFINDYGLLVIDGVCHGSVDNQIGILLNTDSGSYYKLIDKTHTPNFYLSNYKATELKPNLYKLTR